MGLNPTPWILKILVENEPRVHFKIKPGQNVLLRMGITENNVELWMY